MPFTHEETKAQKNELPGVALLVRGRIGTYSQLPDCRAHIVAATGIFLNQPALRHSGTKNILER